MGGTTTTENIMKQLLEAIKVKFEIRLQEKTGWGRNEIIRAYNAKGQRGAACGASAAPTGCASNGNYNERTDK